MIRRSQNFKFWIVIAFLVTAGLAQTQMPPDLTFERLAAAKRFAIGGVGYAGTMSEEEKDFRVILARPSSKEDFERLFTIGNPQAKAYALLGLYVLKSPKFKELASHPQLEMITLHTQSGCIVRAEVLTEVIGRIERGEVVSSRTWEK